MTRDDKSFDWAVCSDKYDCTGEVPAPMGTAMPSLTPSMSAAELMNAMGAKSTLNKVGEVKAAASAASGAIQVAKLAAEGARDATEAADKTETVKRAFEGGVHAYSALKQADSKTAEAQDTVRQLDMIAHTALRHASAAAADGGAEATQAHTAAMFMKSAVTATTDAVAAVDKAAMDMEEVNSLNKLTGGLTASSSSTAVAASNSSDSSDAYEQNAIRLMGQAAQSARKAAQHATGAASKADAANRAIGQVVGAAAQPAR